MKGSQNLKSHKRYFNVFSTFHRRCTSAKRQW